MVAYWNYGVSIRPAGCFVLVQLVMVYTEDYQLFTKLHIPAKKCIFYVFEKCSGSHVIHMSRTSVSNTKIKQFLVVLVEEKGEDSERGETKNGILRTVLWCAKCKMVIQGTINQNPICSLGRIVRTF